jgi:hypothetical protein
MKKGTISVMPRPQADEGISQMSITLPYFYALMRDALIGLRSATAWA